MSSASNRNKQFSITETINGETEPRKVKKKRRRKLSKSRTNEDGTASEASDDEVDEEQNENGAEERLKLKEESAPSSETTIPLSVHEQNGCDDETKCDENVHCDRNEAETTTPVPNNKFDLKPDAEEFIPKAFREPAVVDPNIQYVNFQPNFVPIPIMTGDMPPPQYAAPPFLPPGIPINFVPPNAKIVPNFVNFVPNLVPKPYPVVQNEEVPQGEVEKKEEAVAQNEVEERLHVENNKQHFVTPNETAPAKVQKIPNKTDIDIERIVSKLEEAAKEQRMNENKRQNFNKFNNKNRYHQNGVYQQKKRKDGEERFGRTRNNNHYNKPQTENVESSTPKRAQNYSAMLKTAQRSPRYERQPEKTQDKLETPTPPPPKPKAITIVQNNVNRKPTVATTQWIPVASRKKRKNKTEEVDQVLADEEVENNKIEENDGFESYDVSQLVDVVPQVQEEVKIEEKSDNIPDEIVEATPEIAATVEEETPKPIVVEEIEQTPVEPVETIAEEVKVTRKTKKNKPQTKRIIIKDTYEVYTPEVVETKKVEIVEVQEVQKIEQPLTAITESPVSTPEKRTKRKKKKPQKPTIGKSVSVSSSNTTLNNCDDTYDFLLEPSVLDESDDKTNVEISQELDRLIQKGMYNNLEEKLKTLNTTAGSDNFFSSINLTSPLTFEKNVFLKSDEFSSLFKTTTNLLAKPKRYDNDDFGKLNIDFTKIQLPANEPQPSTSKAGIFLENPEVNEILKDTGNDVPTLEEVPVTKTKSNGKLKSKSKKTLDVTDVVEEEKKTSHPETEDKTKLYPITQAVKEWMTKTRENTPEIELLKSPMTIKKELCEEIKANGDEEVVLFSTAEEWSMSRETSVEETDLLDCWENDDVEDKVVVNGFPEEKASETIEIYESKYGANEDYLKIQAEVEEKTRKINNGTFPKHGNLPYRAICCSIM